MKLTWHGHSCFQLDCTDGTIIFDPYQDHSVPGLRPLRLEGDLVLCSHDHHDHNAVENVKMRQEHHQFRIETMDSYHDQTQGQLRGPNKIHLVYTENMRIVHLGDLGCLPDDEQYAKMQHCDVLLLPIGGYYTIDAKTAFQIMKHIQPRITIPMHYRSARFGYEVLNDLASFTQYCDNVHIYQTSSLTIDRDTPSQTAILTYRPK